MIAKINGIEYSIHSDYSISEQAGNKTSSVIKVDVSNQPIPHAGDIVEILEDNHRIFYGVCGIPKSPKYKSIYTAKSYSVTCGNANSILANRIINVAYQNYTISDIIHALFDKYISSEGISLGFISNVPVILQSYSAPDYNLQDALNELSDLVQGVWKITNEKEFVFLVQEDFPEFPKIINSDFLVGAELQHTTKDSDLRTVQIISGASDVTDIQTESFTYDGKIKTFVTAYPISEKPIVKINGTALSPSAVGVSGLDDQNENAFFLFSYNSKNLNYKDLSNQLKANDIVTVSYVGFYNIRVVLSNQEKINEISARTGTSGMRERVELARGISTAGDAINKASSMLQRFGEAKGEISFWLTTDELALHGLTVADTELLTTMQFKLPEIGITGKYTITERDISAIGSQQKIELKLTDRNYMKSYGQMFNTFARDIKQLSIRADDIVIDTNINTETFNLQESESISYSNVFFPYRSTLQFSLFAPLDLGCAIYPV